MTDKELSVSEILKIYHSVYPVSGEYAFQGERLGIAAVLRAVVQDRIYTAEYIDPNEILKIIEELEEF